MYQEFAARLGAQVLADQEMSDALSVGQDRDHSLAQPQRT